MTHILLQTRTTHAHTRARTYTHTRTAGGVKLPSATEHRCAASLLHKHRHSRCLLCPACKHTTTRGPPLVQVRHLQDCEIVTSTKTPRGPVWDAYPWPSHGGLQSPGNHANHGFRGKTLTVCGFVVFKSIERN